MQIQVWQHLAAMQLSDQTQTSKLPCAPALRSWAAALTDQTAQRWCEAMHGCLGLHGTVRHMNYIMHGVCCSSYDSMRAGAGGDAQRQLVRMRWGCGQAHRGGLRHAYLSICDCTQYAAILEQLTAPSFCSQAQAVALRLPLRLLHTLQSLVQSGVGSGPRDSGISQTAEPTLDVQTAVASPAVRLSEAGFTSAGSAPVHRDCAADADAPETDDELSAVELASAVSLAGKLFVRQNVLPSAHHVWTRWHWLMRMQTARERRGCRCGCLGQNNMSVCTQVQRRRMQRCQRWSRALSCGAAPDGRRPSATPTLCGSRPASAWGHTHSRCGTLCASVHQSSPVAHC